MRSIAVIRMLILVLLLAVSAPACSGDQPLLLWKIKGENCTLHLTGSIHVGKPDFFPLAEPIEQAFQEADALAVEVNIKDPAVLQTMLDSEPMHLLLHVELVGTSFLMWWPVIGPLPETTRLAPPAAMGYLFLQSLVPTIPA